MTFGQAIKTCFNKFVTVEGRASRSEYWWFALSNLITCGWFGIGSIPSFFASIRRLHDVGKSGWWVLCPIVPIFFVFMKSQEGDNKWGPQPVD
jgi:uncharacterized membrane protein YhaH (DUF805 family)